MSTDPLIRDLIEMLNAMREAERDVFGAMAPEVRERPLRPGDWSPKDHQAHLSAWKARQADRYASARRNGQPEPDAEEETDAVNAELQRQTADWSWERVEQQAEDVSRRLTDEVASIDPARVRSSDRLIGGTFGNGAYHAIQHFIWLREAGVLVDAQRFHQFVMEMEQLVLRGSLPDPDLAVALYNTACYAALDGELDRARSLLPRAFRLRPDLAKLATTDTDLVALRDELPGLAAEAQ
jgi:hypothetical protein